MIQKLLIMLLITISISALAKDTDLIVLKEDNVVKITSTFNAIMLEDFTRQVLGYTGKEMFLYFDSPGGSVFAVTRMIGIMKSRKDIKFSCIARFAASAAFSLFQACDNRYLLYDGVLMQHNASLGVRDELPRIMTFLSAVTSITDDLERLSSKRLGIEHDKFKALLNKNLWITKDDTKYKAFDSVKSVICSPDMVKKVEERPVISCSFFSCNISYQKFSSCPLLSLPLPDKVDNKESVIVPINTNIQNAMHIYHNNEGSN